MENSNIILQNISVDGLGSLIKSIVKKEVAELRHLSPQENEPDKLLSRKEVCEILNISTVTLWNWVKDNKIKQLSVGGRRYFKHADVMQALKSEQ